MGYTHYWYREKKIDRDAFKNIANDFSKLLPIFKQNGVLLADGFGANEPVVNNDKIWFNGLEKCGHPKEDLGIAWPSPSAGGVGSVAVAGSWSAGAQIETRCCGGDCSHETFYLPRVLEVEEWQEPDENDLYFSSTKTAFKPYDIAVNTCLIIAKHHLGNRIKVSSDGELKHWFDGMLLCQAELGYGMDFTLDE